MIYLWIIITLLMNIDELVQNLDFLYTKSLNQNL